MGSDTDEIDPLQGRTKQAVFWRQIPRHRVDLDAFYIDMYEVMNARFQQFVHATGYRTQPSVRAQDRPSRGKRASRSRGQLACAAGVQAVTLPVLEQHPVCR